MLEIHSQVNFEKTPCNGALGAKREAPVLQKRTDWKLQLKVNLHAVIPDYLLVIASFYLTDITCSDRTYRTYRTYLECLQSFNPGHNF